MALTPLTESAQQCIDHLQQRGRRAEDLLSSPHRLNRLVLSGTIHDLQTHKTSLSTWKAVIGTAGEGHDPRSFNKAVGAATDLLDLIYERTTTVEETLQRGQESRLLSENDRSVSSLDLLC
jgi:hypothetical protein